MNHNAFDRRAFLRRSGLAAAAGAALPLLGPLAQAAPATAADSAGDPDQLFTAGMFEQADRGYARQLRDDPTNAHALAQRGYIALLSNRFGPAERFLTAALQLAPDDTFTRKQLADCFVRQDEFARAVPLLRQTGNDVDTATAEQYAALTGTPYRIHGAATTRVPMVTIDPLPTVEASVNGGPPRPYFLDTGATSVGFTQEMADELGLRAVATSTAQIPGHTFTQSYGVLESFRLGGIELHNIPVVWNDAPKPAPPDGPVPVGTIGTVLFYHFLTTMDYAGRGLVLRQRSQSVQRRFQAAARHAGIRPLPLWLAATHFPCTLGSLNDFGPRLVSCDTGGSTVGVGTTEEIARQAGIVVDHDHPVNFNGTLLPSITPDEISLGDAVGRHIPGIATPQLPGSGPSGFRFGTIANFSHKFFKPFAITFDYVGMQFYIGPTTGR